MVSQHGQVCVTISRQMFKQTKKFYSFSVHWKFLTFT